MDRAKNADDNLRVKVPAGLFRGGVMAFETSALESSSKSIMIYAPDVGLIVDDALKHVD